MPSVASQLTLSDRTGHPSLQNSPTGPKDDGGRASSPLMRGARTGPYPARTTQQDLAASPSSPSQNALVIPPFTTLPLVPGRMVTGP